jgi:hypothetical protein
MSDPAKVKVTDSKGPGNVANDTIDAVNGPPGAQVKATRRLSDAMNDAADESIRKQQAGGSGRA